MPHKFELSKTKLASDRGCPEFYLKFGDLVWFRFWNHMPERLSDLHVVVVVVAVVVVVVIVGSR